MDALQRYNFMHQAGAVTAHDGRFVLYDEHDRLMAEKDAEIERLRALIKNPHYLDRKARYLKGQLSFVNEVKEMESAASAALGGDNG